MTLESNENFKNLPQLLEQRAAARPAKTFLFSAAEDARRWTYREFARAVNRAARLLLENRIEKGDAVSLLLPNAPEYVIAYFACWRIGAVANPVNSLLKAEEISYVIGNSEAKLLLVNSQFQTTIENLDLPPRILFDDAGKATENFSETLPNAAAAEPDDEAIIIYTSGTTGKPKGCCLTHRNLIANARQIVRWLDFTERDRLLTVMPLFHMNAVAVTTLSALYAGASTVVAAKFSASKFWQTIEDYKITSFGSVATMLSMLLEKSGKRRVQSGASEIRNPKQPTENQTLSTLDSRLSTLRFAMCGSAPVPAEVLRRFEAAFDCLVIEGYGLSESTCRATFNPPNENRRPGSCGLPIGNEMRVFDANDCEVATGELGEIVLRGANVFKGYFKNPAATAEAFRGGWFHTGDIGYKDADGFFYIADRKSDMIIRGGENIYPREIDEVLYAHPAVRAAAVVGTPDAIYGEAVTAFVVLKAGATASEAELVDYCKARLADYKCPQQVLFVGEIPKNATGKLLKRELARIYAEKFV